MGRESVSLLGPPVCRALCEVVGYVWNSIYLCVLPDPAWHWSSSHGDAPAHRNGLKGSVRYSFFLDQSWKGCSQKTHKRHKHIKDQFTFPSLCIISLPAMTVWVCDAFWKNMVTLCLWLCECVMHFRRTWSLCAFTRFFCLLEVEQNGDFFHLYLVRRKTYLLCFSLGLGSPVFPSLPFAHSSLTIWILISGDKCILPISVSPCLQTWTFSLCGKNVAFNFFSLNKVLPQKRCLAPYIVDGEMHALCQFLCKGLWRFSAAEGACDATKLEFNIKNTSWYLKKCSAETQMCVLWLTPIWIAGHLGWARQYWKPSDHGRASPETSSWKKVKIRVKFCSSLVPQMEHCSCLSLLTFPRLVVHTWQLQLAKEWNSNLSRSYTFLLAIFLF